MLIGVNFFCSNVIIFLFCYNATTMLILIYNYNCNLSHLSDYMHSYATHDYVVHILIIFWIGLLILLINLANGSY